MEIFEITMIAVVAALFLALLASALEATLSSNISEEISSGINDMKASNAFYRIWDGQPTSILYTWRQVLHFMKTTGAPPEEIEAANRQIKHYEKVLRKPQTLVGKRGITKKTIIGENNE